jgi:hypothetical protein
MSGSKFREGLEKLKKALVDMTQFCDIPEDQFNFELQKAKDSFKPTEQMAKNAQRALDIRDSQPESNKGMTKIGLTRANQLIKRENLSLETVKRMYSFFSRHEVNKSSGSWKEGNSKAEQAWLGWGGDAGYSWSRNIIEQENKEMEKSSGQQLLIKQFQEEQRISVEIICEPYIPDAHGHWYRPETLEKAREDWLAVEEETGEKIPMNLFHIKDVEGTQLELVKHYIMPTDAIIGDTLVKEGTWVAEVKWNDINLWSMRTVPTEEGTLEIAGVSPRFWGTVNPPKNKNIES